MNMDREVIVFKDVWVSYDGLPILKEINLVVNNHDFLGVIGPNGGGKSTLLKTILGLVKPTKGEIKVFGKNPLNSRKDVGYVPQYSLFDPNFPITVWDVVLMGRMVHTGLLKRYSEIDKKAALDALKTVNMLEYRDWQIGSLSGGQQQRVFIARAVVGEPKLLLLDEPTTGIDTIMREEFYKMLDELKAKMSIVMVSHDIGAVSVLVDKIACLNHTLYYHNSKEVTPEDLDAAYQCPVDLIAHGVPHRVLKKH
jgi:zinc transport system ATP-binding protein